MVKMLRVYPVIKLASRHVLICLYPGNRVNSVTPLLQPLEGHTCCDITRSDSLDMRKSYKFPVLHYSLWIG